MKTIIVMPSEAWEITPGKADAECKECKGTGSDRFGLICRCTIPGSTCRNVTPRALTLHVEEEAP